MPPTRPEIDPQASPFHPLPAAVVALAVVILGLEGLFQLGERGLIGGPEAVGWRLEAVRNWAVSDQLFDWMWRTGTLLPRELLRLVTYPLIHGGITHALFAAVLLLAMGKVVGEELPAPAFLVLFFVSSAVGALAYVALLDADMPLFGAYPGVYGLIGAFTWMLSARLGEIGAPRIRAFSLIGMLLGMQLVFGALFGLSPDWLADLAGFAAGFVMASLLAPGGWARLVARLRRR